MVMKILDIGTRMYAVHKDYKDKGMEGGRVVVCRIKSYKNVSGKVVPILGEIGTKTEINPQTHYTYTDLGKAVDAITTEPKKKKK
jgi:hypothetical protein